MRGRDALDAAAARLIIERKRDGGELAAAEIAGFVRGYLDGAVAEEQMAALLMAAYFRGLTLDETEALTRAYVASGRVLAWPSAGASVPSPAAVRTVDKHSTGGVGDGVSLVAVPWVAACGVPVAKLSGRALAHTGGTIDKLEAIPGLRTSLSPDEMAAALRAAGCVIGAAGPELAPADQRIYALRDRCGIVPSPGLIAASVVSKKIAGGAEAIVFDVKVGSGAFMRSVEEACELARTMVELARRCGRASAALVTDMEEPLGTHVGTGLEVLEALTFLRAARSDARFAACCSVVARAMLSLAAGMSDAEASSRLESALRSGAALARFEALVRSQGGAWEFLQSAAFAPASPRVDVLARRSGYVLAVDAVALGELARTAVAVGGPMAGVIVRARIGDRVERGEVIASLFGLAADVGIPAHAPQAAASVAHVLGASASDVRAPQGGAMEEVTLAERAAWYFSIASAPPPQRPLVYAQIRQQ